MTDMHDEYMAGHKDSREKYPTWDDLNKRETDKFKRSRAREFLLNIIDESRKPPQGLDRLDNIDCAELIEGHDGLNAEFTTYCQEEWDA